MKDIRKVLAPARSLTIALFLLTFLSGCPTPSKPELSLAIVPDYQARAPRSIAVLPFDNWSNDLDATPLIRPLVAERLRYKGYDVPDLEAVDRALKNAGVMVSHDVYSLTPQEISGLLSVDGLMFGTVTDFTTKYAVVYASVAVQLRLELKDGRSGRQLWQNESRAVRNTALENLLTMLQFHDDPQRGLAVVAAQNALFAALEPYYPYAQTAAGMALAPLPPGFHGEAPYPWDLDPYALEHQSVRPVIYQSIIITAPHR